MKAYDITELTNHYAQKFNYTGAICVHQSLNLAMQYQSLVISTSVACKD